MNRAHTVPELPDLVVGANYHPHDSGPDTWRRDAAMMRDAGIRMVRLGHLAWDTFEPADGDFRFDWFDEATDLMHDNGIAVILDIAVRARAALAPRKHPSIAVTDANGNRLYPNHRYMEDVGDPAYRSHAKRFADALTKRYAAHPALAAFGIDNEPGDGPISYSEDVRLRFIAWLRAKYGTVEAVDTAWAGHRWSRRIGDFADVGLPKSGSVAGAPERVLDFRRFVSDEVDAHLKALPEVVETNAPGTPTTTNMWYYSEQKHFDYAPIAYSGRITRAGNGFYPGGSIIDNGGPAPRPVRHRPHPIREHHPVLVHRVHHDDRRPRLDPQVRLRLADARQPAGVRLDLADHARGGGAVSPGDGRLGRPSEPQARRVPADRRGVREAPGPRLPLQAALRDRRGARLPQPDRERGLP